MKFYQGATYNLPFYLQFNQTWIKPEDIKDIEFYFSDIIKKYSLQEITYNEEKSQYLVKISAEDTLKLSHKKKHNLQIRAIFLDGSIKFSEPQECYIEKTNYAESRK